jgi:CRP-like cAMP-binding protein
MMEFDYFQKKCKDVKKNDLQEIISKMKWESESVLNDIYSQGDENDKFYVILRGVVQVLVPNPAIKGRALLYREYKNLLQWKKEEFDPLVELSKIER